ncbi:MAG: hypothetical protein CFH44_01116 [Proteobacteria bacterium]|nr:MAG: hypothetical protein CFH44_01116 [Pseudomonadota bacterium]
MVKKKRFILKMPYFLATSAGPLWVKLTFCLCYAVMAFSHFFPIVGAIISASVNLTVWQIFNIRYQKDGKYKNYTRFLLQRTLFCSVFIAALAFYCAKDGYFDSQAWFYSVLVLVLINIADILFTFKGMVGIGYIYNENNNN